MTYLSNVANERPMLRISATIILAFTRIRKSGRPGDEAPTSQDKST